MMRPQPTQVRAHLGLYRHLVGTTHLHLLAGYGPDRSIQVEFGPLGRAQLPWPDEHMWRHPQGYSDCGLTFISLNGAEHLADLGGFDDRRVVLHLGSDQGALQVDGNIPLGTPGSNRIAKHATAGAS